MVEADKVIGKFGKAYFDLCKRLVGNEGNTIEYCNAFHRSGDEFGVICLFDDPKAFEMVVRELAYINFEGLSKDGKTKVVAYGRVGGYYRECSKGMVSSYETATTIQNNIKDKVAKYFRYDNATAMKNDIKRKDGPVLTVPKKDVNILWKIETDKADSQELINRLANMSIAPLDAPDGQQEEKTDYNGNKVGNPTQNGDE